MLRPRCTVDENVIKENKHKAAQVWAEHVVHQGLEGRRRVGEAERHHQELEVAMVSAERRLLDVVRVHAHLMVARAKVELGEEARSV